MNPIEIAKANLVGAHLDLSALLDELDGDDISPGEITEIVNDISKARLQVDLHRRRLRMLRR